MIVVTPEPTSTDSYAMIKVLFTKHGVKDFLVVVNMAFQKQKQKLRFNALVARAKTF